MRFEESKNGLLESERNLIHYLPEARPAIIAFVRKASADFRAHGGKFRAPRFMRGFASFNAATRIIALSRSEMADAKLAALVEELIHYQQAKRAGVFGMESGWFSRYTLAEWTELRLVLEQEVDRVMQQMGFYE